MYEINTKLLNSPVGIFQIRCSLRECGVATLKWYPSQVAISGIADKILRILLNVLRVCGYE